MSIGYGADLSCPGRLSTARLVGGRTLLAEAMLRRLTTPRGTLHGGAEESAYGIDLAAYVGAVNAAVAAAALPAIIEGELLKDDRIASVRVRLTSSRALDGTVTFTIAIDVTPASELADFALTLAVSAVSVDVIGGMPS